MPQAWAYFFSVASDGDLTVALDITITEELAREGIARELVSRIQGLRKDTGLEVTDRIDLHILPHGDVRVEEAVRAHAAHILAETLALTPEDQVLVPEPVPAGGPLHEVELADGLACRLQLVPIAG